MRLAPGPSRAAVASMVFLLASSLRARRPGAQEVAFVLLAERAIRRVGDLLQHLRHGLLALDHRRELVVRRVDHLAEAWSELPWMRRQGVLEERVAARDRRHVL